MLIMLFRMMQTEIYHSEDTMSLLVSYYVWYTSGIMSFYFFPNSALLLLAKDPARNIHHHSVPLFNSVATTTNLPIAQIKFMFE